MTTIIAVDPGETCGVAVFVDGKVRYTAAMPPTDLYDWWGVGEALYTNPKLRFDAVIIEAFRLYPKQAGAQSWSTFATVEVIGVLRERCRRKSVPFFTQGAAVKKPTGAILKAQKVPLTGRSPHARDAELHGWHYLLSQQERSKEGAL